MATSKNESAAARKARTRSATKQAEQQVPDQPPQPEMVPPNGVLLIREVTPDGNIKVVPQAIGDVKITEIQTIVEVGLKAVRQQLGLDQ